MFSLVARFKATAGHEEALKAALLPCVAPTRAEAGCHTYVLHQAAEDPALFIFYEVWRDQAALDAHMESAHFKRLVEAATPHLAEPFAGTVLNALS